MTGIGFTHLAPPAEARTLVVGGGGGIGCILVEARLQNRMETRRFFSGALKF